MAIVGPRCPICGNAQWHDRAPIECTHCGLCVDTLSFDAVALRGAIGEAFAQGGGADGSGWSLPGAARRNAAWALGFVADGVVWRRAVPCAHDVTLGIIARGSETETVATMIADLNTDFHRIVVVLDATEPEARTLRKRCPDAIVTAHRLAGDFAGQRNRVQALAGDGWVLQLDTDERPDPALSAALGWITRAADHDRIRSLGLARRNLVDGVWSSLWPDIQYRLNRSCVRFAGRVHERPDIPFAQSSLALAGAIEHRLNRAWVVERSKRYEAMSSGAGRPGDEAALLRPFDDNAAR